MKSNLQLAKDYIAALERGAPADVLAAFYSLEVVQEEYPNRMLEQGVRRSLQELLDAHERNCALMRSQRYALRNTIASGDTVILEVDWAGVPAAGGDALRGHFAVFLEFRGGRIVRQRNYDCFAPRG